MHICDKKQAPPVPAFRVTVAIPTFNRLDLLKRSIDSVLIQRYPSLEIIVSDNASTDGTISYLQSLCDPRLKIIFNPKNVGMVANWDRCLMEATGTYFLLLSDDDALLGTDAVMHFVSGFTQNCKDKVGVVFSDVKFDRAGINMIDAPSGQITMYRSVDLIKKYFSGQITIVPCATLMRTSDLQDFGGYGSSGANLAADTCAWMTLAFTYGWVARIPQQLSIYRIHQSLSSASIEVWSKDFEIMRSILICHEDKMANGDLHDVEQALDSAFNLIPLGYIVRKYKYEDNYGLFSAFRDFIVWRRRLLSLANAAYLLKVIFKKIKNS